MDIYEELGIRKVVNAAGTYTVIGATRMSPQTLQAISEAARSYVKITDLQQAVHRKVAELTHNEAAYICNSCSVAIYLAVAAFIAHRKRRPFKYLDDETVRKSEVVAFWNQHIPYDHAIEQLGAKLKFIGYTTSQGGIGREDLRMAINENTVGVYFASRTPRGYYAPRALNLEDVIEVAHECGVPVLVDAAAQLPPKSNLWEFTQMGADVVTFSGGKDLAGPQASGLAVGKKEYLDLMSETGFPNYSAGRLMKIGREEIVGLYAAIRQYMENDEEARLAWCEEEVKKLQRLLRDSRIYRAERCWPNQAGQPLPRSFVAVDAPNGVTAEDISDMLMEYDPGVFCFTEGRPGLYINPMCLSDGDTEYIAGKLLEIERRILSWQR